MTTAKLIPFGYATPNAESRLAALMADERAVLVDIREYPHTRYAMWDQAHLIKAWGDRYVWKRSLGNINFARTGPIILRDPKAGIEWLLDGVRKGYTLILLCGCLEFSQCHRHTVVELVKATMPDIEIEEEDDMKPFNVWRPVQGYLPALSINQPWCWLIANGIKDIENREWRTSYRGPLLLHAGKKLDPACFDGNDLHSPALYRAGGDLNIRARIPLHKSDYQTGGIIGIATLIDVVEQSESPWFVGRYGFVLVDARPLPFTPYKGAIGLFSVPESILDGKEDETMLRARNIPSIVPPELDNACELTQVIAKAEAAKARPKVPVDYWTAQNMDADAKDKVRSALKSKY